MEKENESVGNQERRRGEEKKRKNMNETIKKLTS